jgi:uncharacterized protein
MDNFPNWADHITVFFFFMVIPLLGIKQTLKKNSHVVFTSNQKLNFYLSTCISLFIMGTIVVSVWLLCGRPLDQLGFTRISTATTSWIWALLAFIFLYFLDSFISLSSKKRNAATISEWKKRTPFMPTKKGELRGYLLLCLCASVFEEIVYRGYMVTYFRHLLEGVAGQQILSIALPAFVFSISHFYQGVKAVIKIFIFSVFLGYIFIQSNSLVIVMTLHFIVNLFSGLLTVKYMKEVTRQDEVELLKIS